MPLVLPEENRPKQSVIQAIAYACGIGGQFDGSKRGPDSVRKLVLKTPELAADLSWNFWIEDDRKFSNYSPSQVLEEVGLHAEQLAEQTANIIENGGFPLLIGGDHSAAAGFWSGISHGHQENGHIGLIWFDAHMDSHTPETSPSGYVHGMPLAALLGLGHTCLTQLLNRSPKIRPQSVCLVGVRDYETEEKTLLEQQGVQVFYSDDVNEQGLDAIMAQAISIVTHDTCGYGISFDLDSLDPRDAPGVSTPAENGLCAKEVVSSLIHLATDKRLLGFEISEFNPENDCEKKTGNIIAQILSGLTKRKRPQVK